MHRIAHVHARGERGDPERRSGERRTDGARVQARVTQVRAGVHAGHDEVGRIAERSQARRHHREARRAGDRIRGQLGRAGHGGGDRLDALIRPDPADRGAHAAHVLARCHDDDLVVALVQRDRECVEAGRLDAVVVRQQDPHRAAHLDLLDLDVGGQLLDRLGVAGPETVPGHVHGARGDRQLQRLLRRQSARARERQGGRHRVAGSGRIDGRHLRSGRTQEPAVESRDGAALGPRHDDIGSAFLDQALDAGEHGVILGALRPAVLHELVLADLDRVDAARERLAQVLALEVDQHRHVVGAQVGRQPGERAFGQHGVLPVRAGDDADTGLERRGERGRVEVVHLVAPERAQRRLPPFFALAAAAIVHVRAGRLGDLDDAHIDAVVGDQVPEDVPGLAAERRSRASRDAPRCASMRATQKPWPPGWMCNSPASPVPRSMTTVRIGAGAKTQTLGADRATHQCSPGRPSRNATPRRCARARRPRRSARTSGGALRGRA